MLDNQNENSVSTFKTLNICLKGMLSVVPKHRTAELTQAISICRKQIQNSLKIKCTNTQRKDIKPFTKYENSNFGEKSQSHSLLSAAIISASEANTLESQTDPIQDMKEEEEEENEKKIISITFPSSSHSYNQINKNENNNNNQNNQKIPFNEIPKNTKATTISIPIAIPKNKNKKDGIISSLSSLSAIHNSLNQKGKKTEKKEKDKKSKEEINNNNNQSIMSYYSLPNYKKKNNSAYTPSNSLSISSIPPPIKTTTNYKKEKVPANSYLTIPNVVSVPINKPYKYEENSNYCLYTSSQSTEIDKQNILNNNNTLSSLSVINNNNDSNNYIKNNNIYFNNVNTINNYINNISINKKCLKRSKSLPNIMYYYYDIPNNYSKPITCQQLVNNTLIEPTTELTTEPLTENSMSNQITNNYIPNSNSKTLNHSKSNLEKIHSNKNNLGKKYIIKDNSIPTPPPESIIPNHLILSNSKSNLSESVNDHSTQINNSMSNMTESILSSSISSNDSLLFPLLQINDSDSSSGIPNIVSPNIRNNGDINKSNNNKKQKENKFIFNSKKSSNKTNNNIRNVLYTKKSNEEEIINNNNLNSSSSSMENLKISNKIENQEATCSNGNNSINNNKMNNAEQNKTDEKNNNKEKNKKAIENNSKDNEEGSSNKNTINNKTKDKGKGKEKGKEKEKEKDKDKDINIKDKKQKDKDTNNKKKSDNNNKSTTDVISVTNLNESISSILAGSTVLTVSDPNDEDSSDLVIITASEKNGLFSKLPVELIIHIFSFFRSQSDLLSLSYVNRAIGACAKTLLCGLPRLQTNDRMKKFFKIAEPNNRSLLNCVRSLQLPDIKQDVLPKDFATLYPPHLKNLQHLSFYINDGKYDTFTESFWLTMFKQFHQLRSVCLANRSRSITDLCIKELAKNNLFLNVLDLENIDQLTDEAFVNFSGHYQLQIVSLGNCVKLTDKTLFHLTASTDILYISIDNCWRVTDEGLERFIETHNSIKVFRAYGCANLTDNSVSVLGKHCKQLEIVDIGGTLITDVSIISIANGCPNLVMLQIDENGDLTNKSIACIGKSCLKLESIYLPDQITDDGVIPIAENCKELQEITLDCLSITDNTLKALAKCEELECISLRGCTDISESGIDYLTKRCQLLYKIYVDDETNLNEKKLNKRYITRKCDQEFVECCCSCKEFPYFIVEHEP